MSLDQESPPILGNTVAEWGDAQESRLQRDRRLPTGGADGDYPYQNEERYYRIVEHARSMEREDSVVGSSVKMAKRNTVGPEGPQFDPQTESKRYNQQWWERFQDYSSDKLQCDVSGERTFPQIVSNLFIRTVVDGDSLAVGVEDGGVVKIQCYEGEQIRTPKRSGINSETDPNRIVLGVEMDKFRQKIRFHVGTRRRKGFSLGYEDRDIKPIDVMHPNLKMQQAFHIYNSNRFSQTRGVSALYPVFTTSDYFEDINFAKLVQSVVVSSIGFIEEVPADGEGINRPTNTTSPDDETDPAYYRGMRERILRKIYPGFQLKTKPGHKIQPFTPSTPNPEFFQHAKLMLQLIGVNLGIPLVMLLMDASETNFSGWRGAVQEAKEGFIDNQAMIDQCFLRLFMKLWTAVEIANGRLTPPKNVTDPYRHAWRGRRWPYIEPLKDANAQTFRMRNLLGSPRRVHAELSQEWETEVDHTIADNYYAILNAIKAAQKLNEKAKELGMKDMEIPWQYLLSLPTLDRVSGTMTVDSGKKPPKPVAAPASKPPANNGAPQ